MAEADGRQDTACEKAITCDAFYGGRLLLRQPARGHRAGTDAVLLAAAVPRAFAGLCVDAGSGVGAAGLGVALACPEARVRLVENDPLSLGLAGANVAANGLCDRVEVSPCDLLDGSDRGQVPRDLAQLVVTNPPFHAADRVRASPDARRRAAHILPPGARLADWVLACLDLLTPGGTLVMIHAAQALPDALAALERRCGAVTLLAIHPRDGLPAGRVLLRGVKGSRAPFTIAPPLVLHDAAGFTPLARRVHRGEEALAW